MSDREKFMNFAAMDVVKSSDIRNLNLSKDELLDIYAQHPEYEPIILFLRTIHPDVLHIIAENGNDRTREFVCQKYPLLPKTYDFLLKQNESVRIDLCGNKELPQHIIKELLSDKSMRVRKRMKFIIENSKQKYR